MTIIDMKPHPFAERMPALAGYAKAALRRSMEDRGFDPKDPVVVWLDPKIGEDRILDGVNRRDIAKALGLDRVPVARFEGDRKAALAFVHFRHLARRSPDKSQRAAIVAADAKYLYPDATIQELSEIAGCSISQMEKASSLAHRSKSATAKAIKGELSISGAAAGVGPALNHVPEESAAGEDPWKEVQRTRDKFEAFMSRLVELVQRDFDPLLDRRGGEMVRLSIGHRVKGKSHGQAFFDGLLTQIRRNLPRDRCPTCGGAGCAECNNFLYVTAHQVATTKNAERNGVK